MGAKIWRGLGLVAVIVAASAGLTVLVGWWLLPVPAPASSSVTHVSNQDFVPAPTLDEVVAGSELGNRGVAVVVANGDISGRFVIGDQWKSVVGEDGRYSLAFGSGTSRVLIAGTRDGGQPDVTVTLDGVSFSATDEECVTEFVEFEALEPSWDLVSGWYAGPRGAGTAACSVVEASRTGQVVSLELAFRFDQLWCGNVVTVCPTGP